MSSSAPEWRGFSQSLALGVCHADVMKLFTPWKDFRLHRDLQILFESQVHDHTRIAMNQLLEYAGITIDQLVHVHIYTDGSHLKPDEGDCQQTAWGFNVLGELIDGQCVMLGFMSDDVMIDESEQRYLGATKASALAAEGSAICWALLWWLQSGIQTYAGLTVHSDCLPAGLHMAGEAGWRHHPIMASILRGLAVIAACYSHVAFQHVKGHSGDPFNELADRIAVETAEHNFLLSPELPTDPLGSLRDHIAWAWLHTAPAGVAAAFPGFYDGYTMHIDHWKDAAKPPPVAPQVVPQPPTSYKGPEALVNLRFASVNVLTMRSNEDKRCLDGFLVSGRL